MRATKQAMVKIGVIGTVKQLDSYARYFQLTDGVMLSGVLYTDLETPDPAIHIFQNPEELYQGSDAVYLFPNSSNQFDIALQSIQNGKHIFLEDLSGFTLTETSQLLTSSKEANVKCIGGSPELCHPVYVAAKKESVNPLFIDVIQSKAHGSHQGHNIISEMMSKDITIILDMVKSDIKRIWANGAKVMSDQFDIANVRLEFFNGCVAVLTARNTTIMNERKMTIYDEKKIIHLDLKNEIAEISTKEDGILKTSVSHAKEISLFKYQLDNFRDCILLHAEPIVSLRGSYENADISSRILKKINSFSEE